MAKRSKKRRKKSFNGVDDREEMSKILNESVKKNKNKRGSDPEMEKLQEMFSERSRGKLVEKRKNLMKKWKPFLENGKVKVPENLWEETSVMMDNAKTQLIEESYNNTTGTTAQTGIGQYGNIHTLVLPLVKRVMGKSIMIRDLVDTQPLLGPVGMAFGIRFFRGDYGDGNYDLRNEINRPFSNRLPVGGFKLVFKGESGSGVDFVVNSANVTDALQDDLETDGSTTITIPSNYIGYNNVQINGTTYSIDWDYFAIAEDLIEQNSASNDADRLDESTIEKLTQAVDMGEEDGTPQAEWIIRELSRNAIRQDVSYSQILENWKRDKYTDDGSYDTSYENPDSDLYTDQFNGEGANARWSRVRLGIQNKQVQAQGRQIYADWPNELEDDMKATQNISMHDIMVDNLEKIIVDEVDRELLASMKKLAVDKNQGGADIKQLNITESQNNAGRWMGEKLATMLQFFTLLGEDIFRGTRIGRGNFSIVTPTIATGFMSVSSMYSGVDIQDERNDDTAYLGSINNTKLYEDRWGEFYDSYVGEFNGNYSEILVGLKGDRDGESGVIYCPYRQADLQQFSARDPQTMNKSIAVKMRYGIMENLIDSGAFYRGAVVKGLQDAFVESY